MVERYKVARRAQVGWLVWRRVNGAYEAFKADARAYPSSFGDTAKQQAVAEVKKFPLDDVEWELSLNDLVAKYPAPPKPVELVEVDGGSVLNMLANKFLLSITTKAAPTSGES